MKNTNKSLIDKSGEVRELTTADLKQFKPAIEALPPSLQLKLGMHGRRSQCKAKKLTPSTQT